MIFRKLKRNAQVGYQVQSFTDNQEIQLSKRENERKNDTGTPQNETSKNKSRTPESKSNESHINEIEVEDYDVIEVIEKKKKEHADHDLFQVGFLNQREKVKAKKVN